MNLYPTLYVLNWQGFVGLLPVGFRAAADRCYANGDQLPASIGKPTEGRWTKAFHAQKSSIYPMGPSINNVVPVREMEVHNKTVNWIRGGGHVVANTTILKRCAYFLCAVPPNLTQCWSTQSQSGLGRSRTNLFPNL